MRRLLNIAVLVALVGVVAVAMGAGPAPKTVSSGTGGALVALCDTTWITKVAMVVNDTTNFAGDLMFTGTARPTMVEVKFPDSDVTYSFWKYTEPDTAVGDTLGEWTRLTGRHANSDTVGTLYEGDILRADERDANFVYINRTGTSAGLVNRYY
jgi:hypothetical protein